MRRGVRWMVWMHCIFFGGVHMDREYCCNQYLAGFHACLPLLKNCSWKCLYAGRQLAVGCQSGRQDGRSTCCIEYISPVLTSSPHTHTVALLLAPVPVGWFSCGSVSVRCFFALSFFSLLYFSGLSARSVDGGTDRLGRYNIWRFLGAGFVSSSAVLRST